MSVTPETHQLAMAPYFAVAAAEFELYSVTAVCRDALSAKVLRLVQAELLANAGTRPRAGWLLWCTLAAESTGSHCGGTALLSDRRAWAVERGADEILGIMMVLLTVAPARTRPCVSWKAA